MKARRRAVVVVGREPARAQRRAVVDRRIPAVVLPAVARVLAGETRHETVARHLRDDRRGRDGEALRVAPHDLTVTSRRECGIEDATPVDEHPVVLADLSQRARHRDVAGVIDVEAVYLRHRRRTDAHAHHARSDELEEILALRTREQLRVPDTADELRVRRDETRGRDHRSGERGHADLVDADDAQESLGPELFLEAERGHAPRLTATCC